MESFTKLQSELGLQKAQNASFEPRTHTATEVEQAKRLIRLDRSGKKNRIRDFAAHKESNPFEGRAISELIDLIKVKDKTLLDTIDKFEQHIKPKGFTAGELGMSYEEKQRSDQVLNQALNDYVSDKTGFLATAKNMDLVMKKFGITSKDISHKKLKELIALDDWATLATHAVPLMLEHGPKAIDWLWQKFAKKIKSWTAPGQDAGLWVGDYSSNNVQNPSKVSFQNGVNVSGPYIQERENVLPETLHMDGVNTDFIATYICSERYRARKPAREILKTGVIAGSTTFTLTTDSNGNTMYCINPNNIDSSNVTAFLRGFAFYNPSGYVPSTGVFTNASQLAGPVSTAPISWVNVTSMAVQVIPTTSVNTSQGNYQVTYFPLVRGNGAGAGPYTTFTQKDVMISQYYQSGNSLTSYRGIRIADDHDTWHSFGTATDPADPNSDQFEYFYGMITGGQPNTNVAVVNVYYVVEVIPIPDQAQLTIMDYPTPGVRTADALFNVNYIFPAIQMLTYEQAVQLAEIVRKTKPCYNAILAAVLEYSSQAKVRPISQHNMAPNKAQQISDLWSDIDFEDQ